MMNKQKRRWQWWFFFVRFKQKAFSHFEMRIDSRIQSIRFSIIDRKSCIFTQLRLIDGTNCVFACEICFFFTVTSNMRSTIRAHCTLWKSIISRNFVSKKVKKGEENKRRKTWQKKSMRRKTKKAVDLVELEQLILFCPLLSLCNFFLLYFRFYVDCVCKNETILVIQLNLHIDQKK